jgi:hypothetical protein
MHILRKLLQLLDAKLHRRTPRLVQKLAYGAGSDEEVTPSPTPPRTTASTNESANQTHPTQSHPVRLTYSPVAVNLDNVPDKTIYPPVLPVPPSSQYTHSVLSISNPQVPPPPPYVYIVDPVTQISYPEPPTPVPVPCLTNDARSYLARVIQNPGVLHPQILPRLDETDDKESFYYFAICKAVVARKT